MNKEQLHRYISESTGNESNICQIYAIKDHEVVLDDCWHGFKTTDAMNVNSVTKGVMALLAGIALGKGFIKKPDQKVMDFFPDYTVKRGEKTIYDVTIRHMLTMTPRIKASQIHGRKYVLPRTLRLRPLIILVAGKELQESSGTQHLAFRSLRG